MLESGDKANISGNHPSPEPGSGTDPAAEPEKWAAEVWGVGSPQYRWHLAYAAWRCPSCDGGLVPDRHGGRHRWCEKCDLEWFPQFSEADGSAKRGSMIACFRII